MTEEGNIPIFRRMRKSFLKPKRNEGPKLRAIVFGFCDLIDGSVSILTLGHYHSALTLAVSLWFAEHDYRKHHSE